MDTFGPAAQLVGTINLVNIIVSYIQAIASGEEDRQKLLSEISALGTSLKLLHNRLKAYSEGDGVSKESLEAIWGPLDQCYEALKSFAKKSAYLTERITTGEPFSSGEVEDIAWPFGQGDIRTVLSIVKRLKLLILRALQTASTEPTEPAVLGVVSDAYQKIQDLAEWLSPLDFRKNHNTLFQKHTRGTGEWFLKDPRFLAWRNGGLGWLWCPGHPGVGKSVLVSLVIDELGKAIPENTALVFIYFDYKTPYTLIQLVEATLRQLVQRRMTQSTQELLQKLHKAGLCPTYDELVDMLKVEVGTYTRVFVVIDALDECDTHIRKSLIEQFQALRQITLLATSQDTDKIELRLLVRPSQRLDIASDEGDMRKYIEWRLSSPGTWLDPLLKSDVHLHEEIVTGIVRKAGGTFLLARFHMDYIQTITRIKDLRRALATLPTNLKSVYDQKMEQIRNDTGRRQLAYHTLSWLIHAAQPMTICDLQSALKVELEAPVSERKITVEAGDVYDEEHLIQACAGLVVLQTSHATTLRTSSMGVGLIHHTTEEYLRSQVFADFPHPSHLAVTCLQYVSTGIFTINKSPVRDSDEWLAETPFAEYAILFWGEHVREYHDNDAVRHLAMELLRDNQKVVAVGALPCGTKHLSAIHLCAYFGLKDYLEHLLDDGFDIHAEDSEGDTVVTYAAMHGRVEIMEALLARDDIDINARGWNGTTPLIWAVMEGRQPKGFLISDSMDAKSWKYNDRYPRTAVARAPRVAGEYKAIVQLLLSRDDLDVNRRNHLGNTPIIYAARGGHKGILELLLTRDDVDINSQGQGGRTPLSVAICHGHEAIVQFLLERGKLDVNLRDNLGDTPIIEAARNGHHGIVKLLLVRNAVDINSRGQGGCTPLSVAICRGDEAIVGLLLARIDLEVNSRDDLGNTPIMYAAWDGHSDIMSRLLSRHSVEINSKGQGGRTPLSTAACRGHEVIVQLLLTRNSLDVNPHDDFGDTPIVEAAWNGHSGTVELLLAQGDVDINSRGQFGCTPLSVAIDRGHDTIVQLLLARADLDTSWRDDDNSGYLAIAASRDNEEIVKWLLAKDNIDVNSKSAVDQRPLTMAAWRGRDAIVKLLLDQDGIDINPVDILGNTPLDYANHEHHEGAIGLLREAGGRTGEELRAESRGGRGRERG